MTYRFNIDPDAFRSNVLNSIAKLMEHLVVLRQKPDRITYEFITEMERLLRQVSVAAGDLWLQAETQDQDDRQDTFMHPKVWSHLTDLMRDWLDTHRFEDEYKGKIAAGHYLLELAQEAFRQENDEEAARLRNMAVTIRKQALEQKQRDEAVELPRREKTYNLMAGLCGQKVDAG
jgi:hypothetical protein